MTQGIKPCVDAMVNDLQAQFFEWAMKDKKGKSLKSEVVQGALRPVQLWMYVFPEESLDEVLNTMGIKGQGKNGYKEFNAKATMLRKLMKAEKVPEPNKNVPGRIIRKAGVGIVPIGIRKDEIIDTTGKGIYHEGL